ncbi:hypothetical protein MHZ95_17535 [Sporosarcina sp. ACRSM]|uniref:hypothetical protein n=1 Tax=Sporosarcina sp. ACRSM TaxID=2918216 RepID=UPI001EF68305|nr:hypothetical protein [Sporosarcina sp. ACRSM]MCG7337065.1 hypothetical protein [Sporosarcina sp. ACRSM]
MSTMDLHCYDREKQVRFAVGMATIDDGKPTDFSQRLLDEYTEGRISASDLHKPFLKNMPRVVGDSYGSISI